MDYERVNWENLPSKNTPVNADNLNKMDEGIANIDTKINSKQDKLTAGDNITINDNTISAKDTTYNVATSISNGLMSASDKEKLDNGKVYSTDEKVVGKWYDGRTVYEKTIVVPKLPSSSGEMTVDVALPVPLFSNAFMINGDISVPIPFYNSKFYIGEFYYFNRGKNIVIDVSSDRSSFSLVLVVQYLKE